MAVAMRDRVDQREKTERRSAYVALIGLMPDVRRVYAYHGAEHMTIHAWEHNDPLDPAHVGRYPPAHPRCGARCPR